MRTISLKMVGTLRLSTGVTSLGRILILPFTLALLGGPGAPALSGQEPTELHTVKGVVLDALGGSPLSQARLHFGTLRRGYLTEDDGRFEFVDIPAGPQVMIVERYGYERLEIRMDVQGEAFAQMDIELEPKPVMLDGLAVVSERLNLMESRMNGRLRAVSVSSRPLGMNRLMNSPAPNALEFMLLESGLSFVFCGVDDLCVIRRGRTVRPRVYIDEELSFEGMAELKTFQTHDLDRIEVFANGREVRAYTHHFMERMARRPIALIPIEIGGE
jgi:hypothetical protein